MNGDQSVTVTVPPSIQVQGTLKDSQGNVYTSARTGRSRFTSPLNPGTTVSTDGSGGYSVALLADQNFTVQTQHATPRATSTWTSATCRSGTLDQSQTYNVTLPTAQLTVSVRDASGNPDHQRQHPVRQQHHQPAARPARQPRADTYTSNGTALDASGNATLTVPNGITLDNPAIVLSNGLIIPFTLIRDYR